MPRQRAHRSTISLPPKLRNRLEARGARSDKSHGPYNYTRQLARTLELYDSVLVKSDPRQTRDMAEDDYEMVVAVLTDPLALESFHIVRLGDFLFDLPEFRARARERGIDAQRFRDQLNAFAYAEKLHLVDAAQVRNAPPPPQPPRPQATPRLPQRRRPQPPQQPRQSSPPAGEPPRARRRSR